MWKMSLYTESSLERNITTDIGINFSSMQVTFTIINKKHERMYSILCCICSKLTISILILPVPIQDEEKKIKLNFHFHTSLWCLKRLYEGFLRHHKVWKWKFNLIFISIQLSEVHGTGRFKSEFNNFQIWSQRLTRK